MSKEKGMTTHKFNPKNYRVMKKLSITEEELKQSLELLDDSSIEDLCNHVAYATVWSVADKNYNNWKTPLNHLLDTIRVAVANEKRQRNTRPSNNTEEQEL